MLSLRSYLILMNFVLLGFLFPIVSGYFWNNITALRDSELQTSLTVLKSSMETRGTLLANGMSMSIDEAVAGFDFSFIISLLKNVTESDEDLRYCLVSDSEGLILAHNDTQYVGTILNSSVDMKTLAIIKNRFPKTLPDRKYIFVEIYQTPDNIMHVMSPIYNGNDLWGALRCGFSLDTLDKKIQQTKSSWENELLKMRNSFLSIVLLFFIVAVFVSLLFTQRLVSAIQKLGEGVSQVSDGDLQFTIERKGLLLKELIKLANAFNQMTSNLQLSRKKLSDSNELLEETVKIRTKELEAINKELEAFSYSVSHDLKAPLRSISGYAELLVEDHHHNMDEEGKFFLNRILLSTKKMDSLIKGLLNLSRLGRQDLEKSTLNINSIVENIVNDIRTQNPERLCSIAIQPGMSANADYYLASVVFENLIGNAWKYSSKKEKIEIEIGTTPDNPKIFFVKDNGAGFSMSYAHKLFSPFQRLHKSEEFEGDGIGLATVARIINRHGGKIWVKSEPDHGTTFFFSFETVD